MTESERLLAAIDGLRLALQTFSDATLGELEIIRLKLGRIYLEVRPDDSPND